MGYLSNVNFALPEQNENHKGGSIHPSPSPLVPQWVYGLSSMYVRGLSYYLMDNIVDFIGSSILGSV